MNISTLTSIFLQASTAVHFYHINCADYVLHTYLKDVYEDFADFADELGEAQIGLSSQPIDYVKLDDITITSKDNVISLLDNLRSYCNDMKSEDRCINAILDNISIKLNKHLSMIYRIK